MLVEVRRAATDAGMELRLVRIPEHVTQLLEITALADYFGVANAGPVLA
jgi:anti-anti-sigma regulatory factor